MSLLPYLLEMERPRLLNNKQFALALTPEEVLSLVSPQPAKKFYGPWKQLSNLLHDSGSTIKADKSKFQVNLDVQHFAPEDISVKTVDGFIVIEANHEEKMDEHGWVSRKFSRRYQLPEGCDVDAVQSRLSSDGVLSITVPLERPQTAERIVPIIQTGPVKTQAEGSTSERGDSSKTPVENGQ